MLQVKQIKEQSSNLHRSLADTTRLLADATMRQDMLHIALTMFENQSTSASALTARPIDTSASLEMYNQVSNLEGFENMDENIYENEQYGAI